MNLSSDSPLKELMMRKLGEDYERNLFSVGKNKILMKLLKKALIADVRSLLSEYNMNSPPFDPFKIKQIGNATVEIVYLPKNKIGADGSLEVGNKGFIIKLNQDLLNNKSKKYYLRTTMAHELMHTFFYNTNGPPFDLIGSRDFYSEELPMREELCNFLAREFLFPSFYANELKENRSKLLLPSIENIEFLKKEFILSSDVIAFRMIKDFSFWDAAFAKYVQYGKKYKSSTIVKNKLNNFYNKIKSPKFLSSNKQNVLKNNLFDHFDYLFELGKVTDYLFELGKVTKCIKIYSHKLKVESKKLKVESKIDSVKPLSFFMLIYEDNEI